MDKKKKKRNTLKTNSWELYLLYLPGVVCIIIFAYLPMFGTIAAFQNFDVVNGYFGSKFVGFKYFRYLFFEHPTFWSALKNTLKISSIKLLFGFSLPIILSLLINELRNSKFRKTVQTMICIPNFVSWVVVAGIWYSILSYNGPVNHALQSIGMISKPIMFMESDKLFLPIIVSTDLWKSVGYSTIFYMAAIATIPQDQYEAARIDGASRFQQALYITLPSIITTIVLLFILSSSGLLNAGFDQLWTMSNPAVQSQAEIIDTAVLKSLQSANPNAISIGTALGLFKSVVGVLLFLLANGVAKLFKQKTLI